MAKVKFSSIEEVREYVKMLSIQDVIDGYVNLLWEAEYSKFEPIKITETQFRQMFKIVGLRSDGETERRGRKPKNR